jgi:hypothetical protein
MAYTLLSRCCLFCYLLFACLFIVLGIFLVPIKLVLTLSIG